MNSDLIITLVSFILFTGGVAFFTWYSLKKTNLNSSDGYFLGGRSLSGIVIAGSMLLTNISSEHLIGMNGNSYVNGFIVIAWEVTSSLALANTPDGLNQLLKELNGVFFIPIASVLLAGFFMKKISAIAAKTALIFGLSFYIFLTWGYTSHGIHFVHLWGIEFVLNVGIMYLVSYFYPRKNLYEISDVGVVDLTSWKYAKPMSIGLSLVTVLIYILLGNNA